MAFSVDIVGQGTLSGTPTVDTVRTSTGNETHRIIFTNYSGSDVTVEFYINGTADQNRVGKATIDASYGFCIVTVDLGSTDTFRAKASAATAIVYTDQLVVLN